MKQNTLRAVASLFTCTDAKQPACPWSGCDTRLSTLYNCMLPLIELLAPWEIPTSSNHFPSALA